MAWQSYPFTRLVVAGDLFERRAEPELLAPFFSWCQVQDVEFLGLTPGNHDRGLEAVPELPLSPDGFELGNWRVVHEPTTTSKRWICGHWHPCVRVGGKRVPCYVVGALGLICQRSHAMLALSVETLALPQGSITIPAMDLPPAKPAAGQALRAFARTPKVKHKAHRRKAAKVLRDLNRRPAAFRRRAFTGHYLSARIA